MEDFKEFIFVTFGISIGMVIFELFFKDKHANLKAFEVISTFADSKGIKSGIVDRETFVNEDDKDIVLIAKPKKLNFTNSLEDTNSELDVTVL